MEGMSLDEKLAICIDSTGSPCMGDSGLLDGGRKHSGREDYWYSHPSRTDRTVCPECCALLDHVAED